MQTQVVRYRLDPDTEVGFEVEVSDGLRPAGLGEVMARIREAVKPAVKAAKVVLDATREISPDEVTVTFGIKVTGETDWIVAKASTEGNFEVTLNWKPASPTAS